MKVPRYSLCDMMLLTTLLLCVISSCIAQNLWNEWSDWSTCSVTCGTGYHVRSRTCAGDTCAGNDVDTGRCVIPCPVKGTWGEWTSWGECTKSCDTGYRYTLRDCIGPSGPSLLNECEGSSVIFQICGDVRCPVDGGWSEWSAYSECSQTCGSKALKVRSRRCDSPQPENGGAECVGSDIEELPCSDVNCLDGVWRQWEAWTSCTQGETCGSSLKFRLRQCDISENDGTCAGRSVDIAQCGEKCQVSSEWSSWGEWDNCSTSCGIGTQVRHRVCPGQSAITNNCTGNSMDYRFCDTHNPCPVSREWSLWGEWDSCSSTCGTGTQVRHRVCTSQETYRAVTGADNSEADSSGADNCKGHAEDYQICGTNTHCPVDGSWSGWNVWAECSVSCGKGIQTRDRFCNNPAPQYGGEYCDGVRSESRACAGEELCGEGKIEFDCPSGWKKFGQSCYYFSLLHHDWSDSKDFCENHDAKLLEINSEEENDFIVETVRDQYTGILILDSSFWLSGNDLHSEGRWHWDSGQNLTFTNWGSGEPSHEHINYDCMVMRGIKGFKWADDNCQNNAHWICEQEYTEATTQKSLLDVLIG